MTPYFISDYILLNNLSTNKMFLKLEHLFSTEIKIVLSCEKRKPLEIIQLIISVMIEKFAT